MPTPYDPTKNTEGVRVDTSALRGRHPDTWRHVAANEVAIVTRPTPFVRRPTWWQRWRYLVGQVAIFVAGAVLAWVVATW